jgi:hypothetical protein
MSRRRNRSKIDPETHISKVGVRSIPSRLAELGFGSYREYLASEHWKDLKRRFFASKLISRNSADMFCCGACGETDVRLSVHHRTYKRLGREWLMDLMAVCDGCHETIHENGKNVALWYVTKTRYSKA